MGLSDVLLAPKLDSCLLQDMNSTVQSSSGVSQSIFVALAMPGVIAPAIPWESKPSPCPMQHTERKGQVLVTGSLLSKHFTI